MDIELHSAYDTREEADAFKHREQAIIKLEEVDYYVIDDIFSSYR